MLGDAPGESLHFIALTLPDRERERQGAGAGRGDHKTRRLGHGRLLALVG